MSIAKKFGSLVVAAFLAITASMFATSITNVPYHPGAAKYFQEQGVTVPTA